MYDDIYDQEPLTEEQEFGMTVSELIDKEVERRLEEKAYEQGREDEKRDFLGGLSIGEEVHFMKHTFVSQACKVCGGKKQLTVVHEQAGSMKFNCPTCNGSGRQGDWYWKPYSGKIVQMDVKIRDKGSLSEGKFYIEVDKEICLEEPFRSVLGRHGYTADSLPTGAVVAIAQLAGSYMIYNTIDNGIHIVKCPNNEYDFTKVSLFGGRKVCLGITPRVALHGK